MNVKRIAMLTAIAALSAAPAFAGGTRIHVGIFTPPPVYAAPVVYHPPVRVAYMPPPRAWYPPRHSYKHHGHRPLRPYQVGYWDGPGRPYWR